ncbi:MAG TPA: hypothetical protein QF700_07050 [Prochlorococcus sp.]|nr:hypothetical protein [Prochlorococcus sp.]
MSSLTKTVLDTCCRLKSSMATIVMHWEYKVDYEALGQHRQTPVQEVLWAGIEQANASNHHSKV